MAYNERVPNHPLVSAEDLAPRLGDPRWIIVDCRFDLTAPDAGEAAYRRAHIPGARYAHLDRDLARRPTAMDGRHPLPAAADFAARLGEWGVSNGNVVVAYDEGSGAIAARLWWMMRWLGHPESLVLDGGLSAWTTLGLPMQTQVPLRTPARFVPPRVDGAAVVDSSEIARLQSRGNLVVDARAAARFRGEQEPLDPVAGHVPGACNWPFSDSLAADGRFRNAADLNRSLRAFIGNRDSADVIAMCGSGVTACHFLLAMEVAGIDAGRLFAGSWSEWIRDPDRPVSTGAEP